MSDKLLIEPSEAALIEAACERLELLAKSAIAKRDGFSIALSGGSSPKRLFERLASDNWKTKFNWSKFSIFWGDDRAVPPDSELSNYRMAREALLQHVPIPETQIYRWLGETDNLELAARAYEANLRVLGGPLDLVLLGLGSDGHTASLFPDSPVLGETQRLCVATPIAPLEPHVARLTFTFSCINAARNVWIYAPGGAKAARIQEVMCGPQNIEKLPVQGVKPQNGELIWMLDEAAAAQLPEK